MNKIKNIFNPPHIFGLVLIGGQSKRMGHDKAQIRYYQKPHYQHTADLISSYVDLTFISVAHHQDVKEKSNYKLIKDHYNDIGPMGGILSAFRYNPDAAWLTVACDLPFLTTDVIAHLISQRQASKMATCFLNPNRQAPEPLLTIWEPMAYPIMQDYLSKGNASPGKILKDHDINLIDTENSKALMNANDPLQKNKALEDLTLRNED